MEEDFSADAGEDGHVSKLEFQNSIFQLCDTWTSSCELEEYLDFLEHGSVTRQKSSKSRELLKFNITNVGM